jgi:hypothetical protein
MKKNRFKYNILSEIRFENEFFIETNKKVHWQHLDEENSHDFSSVPSIFGL